MLRETNTVSVVLLLRLLRRLRTQMRRSRGLVACHATSRHRLKQPFDLGCTASEGLLPESVARVLNKLNESDQQAPGVRPMNNQTLQQHSRDLLHNDRLLRLQKEVKQNATEVVRVVIRVAKLVCNGVQHIVASLAIQASKQHLKHVHTSIVLELRHHSSFVLKLGDSLATDIEHQRIDEGHVVLGACLLDLVLAGQDKLAADLVQE